MCGEIPFPKASGLTYLSPPSTLCSAFAMESVFPSVLEKAGHCLHVCLGILRQLWLEWGWAPKREAQLFRGPGPGAARPSEGHGENRAAASLLPALPRGRRSILSTGGLFVTLHQQYPKGPLQE